MKYHSVLQIDDDDDDCLLFEDVVKNLSEPHNYFKANCPQAALDQLTAGTIAPDVIFADYHMPVMNAQEFMVKIKSFENLRHIPIIIFSTTAENAVVKKTLELGAKAYYIKPADYNELSNIIASNV